MKLATKSPGSSPGFLIRGLTNHLVRPISTISDFGTRTADRDVSIFLAFCLGVEWAMWQSSRVGCLNPVVQAVV
jgi:hypothetical protein